MSAQVTEVGEQLARICEQAVELLDALRPWERLTEDQRDHAIRLALALATLAASEDSMRHGSEVSPSS